MKNFELVTASSDDLQKSLQGLKAGIIKQFAGKNFTLQQIFISQQFIQHPLNPNQMIMMYHVIGLVIDNEKDIEAPIAPGANGGVSKIFDQEF